MPFHPITVVQSRYSLVAGVAALTENNEALGGIYRYRTTSSTGHRSEVTPMASKVRRPAKIGTANLALDITEGDLLYGYVQRDGVNDYGKVIDVQSYATTVQANLQVVPYTALKCFVPVDFADQGAGDGTASQNDEWWTPADTATVLAYIEPQGDQLGATSFGAFDNRPARIFTLLPLLQGSVVSDGTFLWSCSASEWYPGTWDYVASARVVQSNALVPGCEL